MLTDPLQHRHEITVVITCYNEAEFIGDTIDTVVAALRRAGRDFEIIVIDDCSRDNSVAVIEQAFARHPGDNVRLVRNATNQGLACNFVNGAFLGSGKYYRLCCGDNAESLESLVNLFSQVGRADLVIPYQLQENVEGKTFLRKTISRTFTFLVNLISGYRLKYYNALPIYLRYHVMRYPPVTYGFGFQADVITRLLSEGICYAQIDHRSHDRKVGKSTALSLRNLLSVCHTVLEIVFRRVRGTLFRKSIPQPREIDLGAPPAGS
ncbi:MAG TPA: glycosyltransferase family 2 protein [Candidatus Methanoperedens sp.]|nr:glycosyltransferase family 2 protein [Candidatus Methanoperedens sp.]